MSKVVLSSPYLCRRLKKGSAITKPSNSPGQFKEKMVGFKSFRGDWLFILNGLKQRDLERTLMESK